MILELCTFPFCEIQDNAYNSVASFRLFSDSILVYSIDDNALLQIIPFMDSL